MYTLALQQDPSSAMAAYRLGQCLSRLGRADEARLSFEHAIELNRGNEDFVKCKTPHLRVCEIGDRRLIFAACPQPSRRDQHQQQDDG